MNTIHVKFAFEQTVQLQWELDAYTADHIIAITDVMERAKYRLSLKCYFNAVHNHHYSYITKYVHGISEKIMFPCSEAYSTKISSLRELESLDALNPSFSTPLHQPFSDTQDQEQEPMESNGITSLQFVRKSKSALIRILVSTIIITMLSFIYVPENSYTSEKVFANLINVSPNVTKQIVLKPKVITKNNELTSPPPVGESSLSINESSEVTVTLPPSPPVVNIDEEVIFKVPVGSVSITFDDGPSLYTKDIAKVLNQYNVGGTFFFVGTQVLKFPDAVKYVDDHGFSIGNHSMTHANLAKLSANNQKYQIEHTNEIIQNITSKPVLLFRPPYGSRHNTLDQLVSKNNMKMVMWNSDPEDWNHNSSKRILDYIIGTQSSGSIILLHESKETLEALPLIIEFLLSQQLEISSLL